MNSMKHYLAALVATVAAVLGLAACQNDDEAGIELKGTSWQTAVTTADGDYSIETEVTVAFIDAERVQVKRSIVCKRAADGKRVADINIVNHMAYTVDGKTGRVNTQFYAQSIEESGSEWVSPLDHAPKAANITYDSAAGVLRTDYVETPLHAVPYTGPLADPRPVTEPQPPLNASADDFPNLEDLTGTTWVCTMKFDWRDFPVSEFNHFSITFLTSNHSCANCGFGNVDIRFAPVNWSATGVLAVTYPAERSFSLHDSNDDEKVYFIVLNYEKDKKLELRDTRRGDKYIMEKQ